MKRAISNAYHLLLNNPVFSREIVDISVIPKDRSPKEACEIIYENHMKQVELWRLKHPTTTITITHSHVPKEEIWDYISLEPNLRHDPKHLDMTTPDEYEHLKGQFLIPTTKDEKVFERSSVEDFHDVEWVAMGGMDFYTLKHFGALRKHFRSFCEITSLPASNSVFYYPLYNKVERYEELVKFHETKNYTSQEMLEFTYKYVIPKIITGEKLSFFCFSASCRELIMIENVCRAYFINHCTSDEMVHEAMFRVNAVLLGYAFDWSTNEKFSFNKLNVTSAGDFGVLRPAFNRELIYGHSALSSGVNLVGSGFHNFAIIFGASEIPVFIDGSGGRVNLNGHSLDGYVNGLSRADKRSVRAYM